MHLLGTFIMWRGISQLPFTCSTQTRAGVEEINYSMHVGWMDAAKWNPFCRKMEVPSLKSSAPGNSKGTVNILNTGSPSLQDDLS